MNFAYITNPKPLTKLARQIAESELTDKTDGMKFCQVAIFDHGNRLIKDLREKIVGFYKEIDFTRDHSPFDALFRRANSEHCRARLVELNASARAVIDFIKEVEAATGREAKA